jgi:hypothetical protein
LVYNWLVIQRGGSLCIVMHHSHFPRVSSCNKAPQACGIARFQFDDSKRGLIIYYN